MSSPGAKSVAIIGGGITGLAAAWSLDRAGARVTVFEKSPQVGGAILTTTKDGWLIEGGPNSLQETAEVATLLNQLGLTSERLVANVAANQRFIVRHRRLVPVPLSPAALLTSRLFSLRARLKVLAELVTRPRVRTTDTSLANLIAAHFGREIVDYGLNPFVA